MNFMYFFPLPEIFSILFVKKTKDISAVSKSYPSFDAATTKGGFGSGDCQNNFDFDLSAATWSLK